jgi:hypothetical protein
MLRLFIRSCPRTNPLSILDDETAQAAETIASDTIDSTVCYLSLRSQARPWCTYLILLLIEASSRVAPIVKRQAGNPSTAAYRTMLSIMNAQDCLRGLASTKLRITGRALVRLNQISQDVNVAFSMAMPVSRGVDAGDETTCCRVQDQAETIGSPSEILPPDDWVFDASKIWQAGELADLLSAQPFSLGFIP